MILQIISHLTFYFKGNIMFEIYRHCYEIFHLKSLHTKDPLSYQIKYA